MIVSRFARGHRQDGYDPHAHLFGGHFFSPRGNRVMGLDRSIRFPSSQTPNWDVIQSQLARVGEAATLRMIDGLPAFPDELPEPGWQELRLGLAAGMVTIRSQEGQMTCVVWGNADDCLKQGWLKVIWACASAGAGVIESEGKILSADEFARLNAIPG